MSRDEVRRDRLSQFVDLARIYRRWTKIQTAQALGREPSKVVPESGNPKLDLVVGLAEALDWDVGDVAEGIWRDEAEAYGEIETMAERGFAILDREAIEAHRAGEYRRKCSNVNARSRIDQFSMRSAISAVLLENTAMCRYSSGPLKPRSTTLHPKIAHQP